MKKYYVHTRTDNNIEHEVHSLGCTHMPKEDNRIYLGEFSNCKDAVAEAKEHYRNSNGCWFCTRKCHTG